MNEKLQKNSLKLIASCIGQYKWTAVFAALFVVLEVVLEVFIPLIMAEVINVGLSSGLSQYTLTLLGIKIFTVYDQIYFILACGAFIILSASIALVFGATAGKLVATASTGFGENLRAKVFYKVQRFSFKNLDNFNTASMITRLTTDVNNVQNTFMMVLKILMRAPFMMILALTMAISINPSMSLSFLVAIPMLVIGIIIGIKVAFPRFEKMLAQYDNLNQTTQENLIGMRVVKSFVREEHQKQKAQSVADIVQTLQFRAEKIMVCAMPAVQIIIYSCIITIVLVGGNSIIAGEMQAGYLTSFLNYVMQIMISLVMVAVVLITVVLSKASMARMSQVLNEEIDITDTEGATDIVPADGSVEFRNVNFSYSMNKDVLNLENINLNIKSGETIGIIGATGSAKTSLVQLIPRLYDVLDGQVMVGGNDVRDYKIDNLRGAIGVVLQKNVLFSGTIKENLLWGRDDASDEEIEHACRVAHAHDFIMSFPDGYETMLEQGGSNVSGGQRQRLCIARALVKKPKIMILDDSTSAVDTATDASIRSALKAEFADTTVFIIAQRITSISDSDRIIVLDDGKINAVDTHENLIESNEIYRDVFFSQQKGAVDNE